MLSTSRGSGGFNPYGAGNKTYGGGRPMPTIGRVDPMGYAERDNAAASRRNALLRYMKKNQRGDYFSSDWLRGSSRNVT